MTDSSLSVIDSEKRTRRTLLQTTNSLPAVDVKATFAARAMGANVRVPPSIPEEEEIEEEEDDSVLGCHIITVTSS